MRTDSGFCDPKIFYNSASDVYMAHDILLERVYFDGSGVANLRALRYGC